MPRSAPAQVSFNRGELSPRLGCRIDQDAYGKGCYVMENFIPDIAGPAVKRGGTAYASSTKTAAARSWFLEFELSATEAYVLEFGNLYIRFFKNRAPVLVSGVAAYNGATAYVVGDLFSSGGVNYYVKAAVTGTAAPNATYYHPLTGNIFEIPSPYTTAQLVNDDGGLAISFVQSGDIIYMAHRSHQQRKLSHFDTTTWTLTNYAPTGGPFGDVNITATTVYASAATGAGVTLTSSAALFTADMVGTLFYLEQKTVSTVMQWEPAKAVGAGAVRRSGVRNYSTTAGGTTGTVTPTHTEGSVTDGDTGVLWEFLEAGYGWVQITAVGGSTTATCTVLSRLPAGAVGAGNPTTKWAIGAWSDAQGWPDCVTFYLDRLVFARDALLWMTVSGDYENMQARDFGRQTTESAITLTIPSRRGNRILWLETLESGLVVGTGADEWQIAPASRNDPLGPLNVAANPLGAIGSRGIPVVRLFDSIVFAQRSGRKLRDLRYIPGDGAQRVDLNAFADHITTGFVSLAYTAEPYSMIWGASADGALCGVTYYPEQEVLGWARFPLDGFVECVTTIPAPDGRTDDLWLIVRRTINGATTRYVEYMRSPLTDTELQSAAFYVDSGITYSGAATTTITGLGHLEGETVNVLVNGATHPQRVVTGGQITLQNEGTIVHVGLPLSARLATMDIEAGSATGTAQGKIKRVHRGTIRLHRTLGGKAGPSATKLDTLQFRDASVPMGSPPPLFTGDKEVPWPGGSSKDARMWFVHDDPLPAQVLGFLPKMDTEDG
jgi:hypothetical protein